MKLRVRGGIWQVDLRAEGLGRYSTGCRDKQRAKEWALQKLAGGYTQRVQSQYTVGQALDKALAEHYEVEHPKGLRTHRSTIYRIQQQIGLVTLDELSTPRMMQFVNHMRANGLSGATINRHLAYLSKALRLANMWGWLNGVPVVPRLKENAQRHREVTPEEEQQLVQVLYNHWLGGLVQFLLNTGCRVSEALAITEWDRQRALDTGGWTIWESKGDRVREVPLNDKARAALLLWSWKGQTYQQAQLTWAAARQTLRLTDDKGFTLHCLRHTCASRLVQAGVHLLVVKDILGHSSVTVTERYAHAAPAASTEAMSLI